MKVMESFNFKQRGFSLVELVVAVVVILVLLTGTYVRYMALVADAERAAFQGVMGWLQAGLNMEMGRALTGGGKQQLQALQDGNPMVLVSKIMEVPSNYLGELDSQQSKNAKPGHWYFDLDQRLLVYRVRYDENLEGIEKSGDNKLSFVLKVVYDTADNSNDGTSQRAVRYIRLQPLNRDFWKTPLGSGRKPE